MESETHYVNVRRIVFAAFKKKIAFEKDGMYVINIDADGCNNRIDNLELVTKSQKQRLSIERGRQDFEYLSTTDRSSWKKNYSKRIPINQYSANGKLIKKIRAFVTPTL